MTRRALRQMLGLLIGAGLAFTAPPPAPASADPCDDGICAPGDSACPAEAEAGPAFIGYGDSGALGEGCAPEEDCFGKIAVRGLASYRKNCAGGASR